MLEAPDLQMLVPMTLSAASCRMAGPITQLARTCRVMLTLVHVEAPGAPSLPARRALDAFLRHAAGVEVDARVLTVSDDPAAEVAAMCHGRRFDLIMAPASGDAGLRGLFTRSFRARVLARCPVPLWTAGAGLPSADFSRPIRDVACLVDFDEVPAALIPLVSAFAQRMGARMHLLTIIPPVDEGTLAGVLTSNAPLRPEAAVHAIEEMAGCDHEAIEVETGRRGSALRRLLARRGADLLFVGSRQAATSWGLRFASDLDRLPCPVVCVDANRGGFPGWSFQERPPHFSPPPDVVEAVA